MTTASVAYSSVLSMPLNTLLLSAAFPSGPVTWEARPSAWDPVIARMEPAAVAAPFQPWLPRLTDTMVWMALPSADGIGPVTWPAPTPWSLAKLRATTAGKMFGDWKRACRSRTWVDSALAGSQALASFFSAPISLFDSGKATTTTTSQKPTTSHLVQLPAGISAILLALLIDAPCPPPPLASRPFTLTQPRAPNGTQGPSKPRLATAPSRQQQAVE